MLVHLGKINTIELKKTKSTLLNIMLQNISKFLYQNENEENLNERLENLVVNNINILNNNNIRDYILNGIRNRDNVFINDRNDLINRINNIIINQNIDADNILNLFINYLYQNMNEENIIQQIENLVNNNINALNNNNIRRYILITFQLKL